MRTPLVSVVIPTYNRPQLLLTAIQSVTNQTYNNIEIIVVDDNSDHDVEGLINEEDMEIEVYSNNENKGANWCRAKGIEEADGEYIAFLDDDDCWNPDKISQQVKVALQNKTVGVVSCGVKITRGDEDIYKNFTNDVIDDLTKTLLAGHNVLISFSTVLVSTEVLNRVGKPDPSLSSSQDLEWFIRLSTVTDIYILSECMVTYNDEEDRDRITDNKIKNIDDSYGEIIEKHENLILEYGWIFRLKVESNRNYKLSRYCAQSGDFRTCREYSIQSFLWYPVNLKAIAMLVISFTGNDGYRIMKWLRGLL